jgi:hypothetical protein
MVSPTAEQISQNLLQNIEQFPDRPLPEQNPEMHAQRAKRREED